jgi:hypothetical protein
MLFSKRAFAAYHMGLVYMDGKGAENATDE